MCRRIGGALLGAALTFVLSCASTPDKNSADLVNANDNTVAAGHQRAGVLTIHLVAQMARWTPEGPATTIVVPAFAEEGKRPRVPGPLIRVPRGTEIAVTIRNAIKDSTLTLHGFLTRPSANDDSVKLNPGETKELRFKAGEPGTYLYYGIVGQGNPDYGERETLSGAFVVDSSTRRPHDRIFVMNIFSEPIGSDSGRNALAINGYSWPYTERLIANVGETQHWRIINATARTHPMHLHGFYFALAAQGDALRETVYSPDKRRLAVTEQMAEGSTMTMEWTPDRTGNWLFHCHLGFHVVPEAASLRPPDGHEHQLSGDANRHMAGLVLGIEVRGGATKAATPPPRRLDLFLQEGKPFGRAKRGLGFVLQRAARAPAADSIELPGSTIVLERGQPADIVVHNRLRENTGVHWHGIELESPSDGVVGWSGAASHLAPPVAPGDSFTAHLTLPRAGTFIYHTHLNDLEQLTSGMYGALLVLEPGQTLDPRTDHLFVFGWNGPSDPPRMLVNGDSVARAPLVIGAGKPQRLRFINIGVALSAFISLRQDTTVQSWRALAKDGADLPPALQIDQPSTQRVSVGETFDFVFTPKAGKYTLSSSHPSLGTYYSQTIIAR